MSFPLTDNITDFEFTSRNKTLITRSLNGNEQRAQTDVQKWEASITLSNLSAADRRELQNFIAEQKGSLNAFEFELPGDLGVSSAGFTGTITLSAGASAGATQVSVTATADTAILKKGDLVRFTNSAKTYMVTADVTTNGSGAATIEIEPALLEAEDATDTVTHNPATVQMRLDGEDFSYSMDQNLYGSFSLKLVEVL